MNAERYRSPSPAELLGALIPALVLALGCRTAPVPRAAAAPASQPAAEARPSPASPDDSSPQAVVRAFIAAALAGNFTALAELSPPNLRPRALSRISKMTDQEKAELKATGRKLAGAMAEMSPAFVRVEAILAEPAHYEWYYCGEKPQGDVWESPCAFSVIDEGGRWYFLGVTDLD